MTLKLIGALIVIFCCGGIGFSIAGNHRREVLALQNLITGINRIICELEYKLKPLPELMNLAAQASGGVVGDFFLRFSKELETNSIPDAASCFVYILSDTLRLPKITRMLLNEMGKTVGKFNIDGQLDELKAIRAQAELNLKDLTLDIDKRLRSYETLGVCAGAAIAILFV